MLDPRTALLSVENLQAWYGESHILHGMSFSVQRGELVTLAVFATDQNDDTLSYLWTEQVAGFGFQGATRPLTFTREGSGTRFYTSRLRYAADALHHPVQLGLLVVDAELADDLRMRVASDGDLLRLGDDVELALARGRADGVDDAQVAHRGQQRIHDLFPAVHQAQHARRQPGREDRRQRDPTGIPF